MSDDVFSYTISCFRREVRVRWYGPGFTPVMAVATSDNPNKEIVIAFNYDPKTLEMKELDELIVSLQYVQQIFLDYQRENGGNY